MRESFAPWNISTAYVDMHIAQPGAKRGLGPFVERRLEDNEAMHGLNMIRSKFSANHRQSSNKVFVLIPDPCPITTECTVCHLEANSFARLSVQSRVQQQQESVVEYVQFFSVCLPFLSLFQSFCICVFLYFVFLLSQGCVYQQMDAVCKMLRHLRGVKEGESGKGRMILPACILAQSSY